MSRAKKQPKKVPPQKDDLAPACSTCGGLRTCPDCDGQDSEDCPTCDGSGVCPACDGSGKGEGAAPCP